MLIVFKLDCAITIMVLKKTSEEVCSTHIIDCVY
jgi:hypothetical protein